MLKPTHDLTTAAYFSHPAINRSSLSDLERSPLHYWARHIDPTRIETRKDSPALRFGTATHTAVLEPERFEADYAEGPMASRSTKIWKEAAAASKATLLPPDEMVAIRSIVESLKSHDSARKALFAGKGHNEATFIATDQATGLELKCRADRITQAGYIVDLKTTADASATAFAKSVHNFGYHIQAAFYMRCIEAATGTKPTGFAIVAVEKEPPYACQVFIASESMLETGARKVDKLLSDLARYRDKYGNAKWPSYSDQPVELNLPHWAEK